MIGPHQGKELELMLAGRKHLAVFSDTFNGNVIPEEIIPEKAFAPHVEAGAFIRFQKDSPSSGTIIRYVCFTTPGETHRAKAYFWILEQIAKDGTDGLYETMIGRLLDYDESDILHYLENAGYSSSKVKA